MKKIISMTLAVPLFAISMLLFSCVIKNKQEDSTASETAKTQTAGPAYVLASDLAIKSLLVSKETDLASLKKLYKTNEVALLQRKAINRLGDPICCFPCPITGECPGPPPRGLTIIGRNDWKISRISLGDNIFKPDSSHRDSAWTVFKSEKDLAIETGEYDLTMTATFFGEKSAEYRLPIVFKKGKAYMIE